MHTLQSLAAAACLAGSSACLAGVGAYSATSVSYLYGAPVTPLNSINFTGATSQSAIAANTSGGTEDAYARASLQEASLKARSGGTADRINGSANALMGDTFSAVNASNGQAYAWTAGAAVTFNFAVTGSFAQSLSSAQMAAIDSGFTSLVGFGISAYRPGYFVRAERIQQLQQMSYTPAVAAEWQQLQNEIDALRITSTHSWLGRPYSPYFNGATLPYVNVDAQTPTTLSLTFNPQGSFEWLASLNVETRFQPGTPLAQRPTFVADFSHSVGVSFSGPPGTVTTSSTGLFPGSVSAVPEPQTWALWLAGVGAVAGCTRRARRPAHGSRTTP